MSDLKKAHEDEIGEFSPFYSLKKNGKKYTSYKCNVIKFSVFQIKVHQKNGIL